MVQLSPWLDVNINMQRIWKGAAWGVGMVLGVVAILFLLHKPELPKPPEPSYQGKTLSEWMCPSGKPAPWNQMEFDEAIHHIGTNAMPCLLYWMQYQEPAWNAFKRSFFVNSRDKSRGFALARATERAFESLGPEAKDYVPELTQMMNDTNKPNSTAWWAIWGISFMGPDALRPLMNALTNTSGRLRNMAAIVIPHLGTNAYPAIPLLVSCLTNSPEIDTTDCELALGKLKLQPEISIPALTARLDDSRASVRKWAAEAIGMFGTDAQSTHSMLPKALDNSDKGVRMAATNALRASAPPR
jgi:hypothetical protein